MKTLNELIFENEEIMLIKAKRTDNGEWIMGYPVPVGEKTFIICCAELDIIPDSILIKDCHEINKDTICRFTGKYTVLGEPVWENDKVVYHFDENKVGVVRYGTYTNVFPNTQHTIEKHHGFYVEFSGKQSFRKDLGYWFGTDGMTTKVSGNIFD